MKNNTFTMVDDKGKETTYEVLFTFESEETHKNYVAYTDNSLDETGNIQVYASIYDPNDSEGQLTQIESQEEWKVIETILETIQDEIKKKSNANEQ